MMISASNFSMRSSLALADAETIKQSRARKKTPRNLRFCIVQAGGCGLRRGRRRCVEADLGGFAFRSGGSFEKFARLEAEHVREDVGGELLNLGIEIADDGVIVAARVLDGVLDLRERILQ